MWMRSEILGFIIKLHSPKLWPLPSYPKSYDLWMANLGSFYTLFYEGLCLPQWSAPALTLVFAKIRIHQTCSQMDFFQIPQTLHIIIRFWIASTHLEAINTWEERPINISLAAQKIRIEIFVKFFALNCKIKDACGLRVNMTLYITEEKIKGKIII